VSPAIRVSVIIAVRNDAPGIRATLAALAAQTLAARDFEVLVVDDASTDDTAIVADAHGHAAVLRQREAQGAYVARNRGLQAARGDVVAITDAGCIPAPTWLERGISRLEHEGPDALLAGDVAMPLGPDASLAAMVDVVHHLDQRRLVWEEGTAVTANLMVPASAFARVGPFDERMRRGGDRDWTGRARRPGLRLVYAEEVVVVHPPRAAGELLRKSLAVGRAGSEARRQAPGPRPRPSYLQRGMVIPRHRRSGKQRVRANGASPGRGRWLAVGAAQLALVQIPQAAAALVADVRARRR
jgi:GT2 family glycosyltransferase